MATGPYIRSIPPWSVNTHPRYLEKKKNAKNKQTPEHRKALSGQIYQWNIKKIKRHIAEDCCVAMVEVCAPRGHFHWRYMAGIIFLMNTNNIFPALRLTHIKTSLRSVTSADILYGQVKHYLILFLPLLYNLEVTAKPSKPNHPRVGSVWLFYSRWSICSLCWLQTGQRSLYHSADR